ncbi:sugar transferase [Parasediminibacterium paludis]|uniref:Sugar transferase n=1 Tax=Parasediminibacterium paludis TaxID=908966 RepID=A0ABV8PUV0_9BACT
MQNTLQNIPKRSAAFVTNFKGNILPRAKKQPQKKLSCLLVNPDVVAKELIKKPSFNNKFTYNIWSGPMDNKLIKYLKKNNYSYVVIDKWISDDAITHFLDLIRFHDVNNGKIINIISFYEKVTHCSPMLYMNDYSENNPEDLVIRPSQSFLMIKRAIDIVVTSLALPIAIPIMMLAFFATWLSSKGPVLFKQQRVGFNGKVFTIYKIRTMVHNPLGYNSPTIKGDSRITKVGRILRKTKIDEFPQFLNVLKGEMSLIGPRPEKKDIVDRFESENSFYKYRHIVKPGITGWAQVNYPTATPEETLQKLEYDLYYINHISLKLEMQIILKTAGVITTLDSL